MRPHVNFETSQSGAAPGEGHPTSHPPPPPTPAHTSATRSQSPCQEWLRPLQRLITARTSNAERRPLKASAARQRCFEATAWKKKEETEPNHFPSLCRCIVWGEGGVEGGGGLGLGGVVVGEGIKRLHQRGPQQEMRTPAQAGKLRTINIFMRPCIFHAGV